MSESQQRDDEDDHGAAAMDRATGEAPTLPTFEPMAVDVRTVALSGFTCGVAGRDPLGDTRSPGQGAGRYDVTPVTLEPNPDCVVDRMVLDVARRYEGVGARLLLSGELRVDVYRVSTPPLRVADLRTDPILYRANARPERLATVGAASPEWELVRSLTDVLGVAAIELPGQSGPHGRDYLIRAAHRHEISLEPLGALHEIAPMLAESSTSASLTALVDFFRRMRRT